MAEEQFRREVGFTPAYDLQDKGYGIHGVDMRFHLIGEHGATQFVVFTNWQLPEVTKEQDARPISRAYPHLSCHPLPADLGYHRRTPAYEGQSRSTDPCEFLNGECCYYDGSGLQARDVFDALTREGDAAVWQALEKFYRSNVLDEADD